MNRRLLVHSSDRALACRVGVKVAEGLGWKFVDGFGSAWEESLQEEGGGAAVVVAVPSRSLLERERRVEILSRDMVVALEPGLGSSGEDGIGDLVEGLAKNEFREGHAYFSDVRNQEADVAARILSIVRRGPVAVAARERSYLVEVGEGLLEGGLDAFEFKAPVLLHLTDENVERLHGDRIGSALGGTGLRVVRHVLVPGEERKCMGTLSEIFERALEGGIDRTSWVVASGGGVTTDIGGLVAALWMRGLRWVAIPTTLLAMVDASVGGKTAIDFGVGKNSVGAFWQPSAVFCDVGFLVTESARNYVGALSEVVKTAVIGDRGLFELLERERELVLRRDLGLMKEVVRRCVQVKARIVGLDELESGLRAVLNLGHTMGHALEALGEYRRYTHGEAVSLGMVGALRLGVRLGHTAPEVAERIEGALQGFGLPVKLDETELRSASELLGHDKKRAGSALRFVFARDVGDVLVERVGLEDVRELMGGLLG